MKITNVHVYGLDNAIRVSKFPMAVNINNLDCEMGKHTKDLFQCPTGFGHDNALKGIIVQFDMTFSNKMSVELERYHFIDFISSQSTMHKITSFKLEDICDEEVDKEIITIVNKKIEEYKENPTKENYIKILKNLPAGLKLTARMTTNYRCLKNIIQQRENHRLSDWTKAVEVFKKLPFMEEPSFQST